jgi:competence protein ComEC
LLAISGLHIGLVAGGLGAALRRLMVPRVATALMVAAAAVVYALLTEARPPALRATVLVVLGSLAYCMGRRPLSANLIAAAGLVVIAVNPGEVFRTGTQLSFLAVASLAYFRPWRWLSAGEENPLVAPPGKAAPWYLRMGRQFLVGAGSLFLVGMVIWLVALPLVASRFHLVAPVALPLNPLLWPFMSLAMVSGFGVLVTGWLWSVPAAACGQWCNGSLAVLETAVAVARDLPCGHFWVPGPAGWWLVGFYGGLAGMAVAPRLRPPPRWQAALLAGWIAVGFSVSTWRSPNDEFRCTFLSVGHGCAIVAQLPSGKTLLYDCGGLIGPDAVSQSVASALWDSGITHLDAVVLSHADVDHFNGLPKLLERFSVGVVYVSPVMFHGDSAAVSALERALGQRGVRLQPVFGGDRLVDPTCLLEILHPPRGGVIGEDNANSVVLRIETPHCRVLLPGDLESPGLNDVLAEEPQDCDVLLAPHHGSASGNPQELAAWCSPDIVVISGASYSNWDKAARAYRASGARVLHTGTEGAICVRPGVDGTIAEAKPPRLSW